MIWLLVISGGLYLLFMITLILGWFKLPRVTKKGGTEDVFVSVIIPVRNEEENIINLLQDLGKQSYRNFEVIVVDDHSEDATRKRLAEVELNLDLKVLQLEGNKVSGNKKAALQKGIETANGLIILTTDGDCRLGNDWVLSMIEPFQDQHIELVSGPVSYHKRSGIFQKMQFIEFASLIGSGAATMNLGFPTMCNGANLAFRKKTFEAVEGYKDNEEISSGDDEFLMHKVYKRAPRSVIFQKNRKSLVMTEPNRSFKDFENQRLRWASKWKYYKLRHSKIIPVFVLIINVLLLVSFIVSLLQPGWWKLGIGLVSLKLILDFTFLFSVIRFFGKNLPLPEFLLIEVFHIFYVIMFGIRAQKRGYMWKGRYVS